MHTEAPIVCIRPGACPKTLLENLKIAPWLSPESDLAALYEVETSHLNRAVKRNPIRFPNDFMFQLTPVEHRRLICQFGISNPSRNRGRGGRRHPPYAFTEQGVAMLASVLNSDRAAQANVIILRAFFRMRDALLTHKEFEKLFGIIFAKLRAIESIEAVNRRIVATLVRLEGKIDDMPERITSEISASENRMMRHMDGIDGRLDRLGA